MHSDNFDLSLYFRRIGYSGPAAADTATLQALMRHQLFAIPFENLDVQAGKIVSMDLMILPTSYYSRDGAATAMNSTDCLRWRWRRWV
jgi:hypothetical protein